MKINNFRGELTDNSAKKEALVVAHDEVVTGRYAQQIQSYQQPYRLQKNRKHARWQSFVRRWIKICATSAALKEAAGNYNQRCRFSRNIA